MFKPVSPLSMLADFSPCLSVLAFGTAIHTFAFRRVITRVSCLVWVKIYCNAENARFDFSPDTFHIKAQCSSIGLSTYAWPAKISLHNTPVGDVIQAGRPDLVCPDVWFTHALNFWLTTCCCNTWPEQDMTRTWVMKLQSYLTRIGKVSAALK